MKRVFMAEENDKGGGGAGSAQPTGKPQDKEGRRLNFLRGLTDPIGAWGDANPMKASIIISAVAPVIGIRVVNPAYEWAKGGVIGLFKPVAAVAASEVVADKVVSEAKNAVSIGDMLGFVSSAIGVLVKK